VYCWVFAPDGSLLVQRRSPHKKIGARQLDLSVAEHLQPGEGFRQGAVRGLAEELGIRVAETELRGPLAPTHRRELHQGDFHDVELVQSFRWCWCVCVCVCVGGGGGGTAGWDACMELRGACAWLGPVCERSRCRRAGVDAAQPA
jgi:ADP-ribose pyrophosphatase YjhB (NUDIX family)